MDRVIIFDTTLRDGEQAPGFSMDTMEKLKMARQLARLQVDVIEAGAGTINIPDTVGYAIPREWGERIARIRERVRGMRSPHSRGIA